MAAILSGCVRDTRPCTPSTCFCLTVINLTSKTIYLKKDAKADPGANATFVPGKTAAITITTPAMNYIFYDDSGKSYGGIPKGQTSVTFGGQEVRAPLSSKKRTYILIFGILFFVLMIVASVFAHKQALRANETACDEDQVGAEECAQLQELGQDQGSAHNSVLIALAVLSGLIGVALIVLWLWAFGPMAYASYGDCAKRKGFGDTWFWVKPRSGFRKFLCSAFGACECAADSMANLCDAYGRSVVRPFRWEEEAAAKSKSSTNTKFCCYQGTCLTPENN